MSAPALAVVLVHYHTPAALRGAVRSIARDLEASGLAAEWCVVDNGSTDSERAELEQLGLPIVAGRGNHGFAAGVNAGVLATTAPIVVVANPDVSALPGCIAALVGELASGAAAVAPRLYWDDQRRFFLPPGEARTRSSELLALAALRWPGCAAQARRRFRRDALRHWESRGPITSTRLSGALLAFTRAAWDRVGPFDEEYRLYFEETDWLLRLEAAGLSARQAANAEAVHGFAHSTQREPMATHWFEESARRFRERHFGRRFARAHDRLARLVATSTEGGPRLPRFTAAALARAVDERHRDDLLWLELSPNPVGYPAAGERVRRADLSHWMPPIESMRASGLGGMSLTVVTARGRELGRWWIEL